MSIKLSDAERSQLILLVAELLGSVRVARGGRPLFRRGSLTSDSLQEVLKAETAETLYQICGEAGAQDFLHAWLYRRLVPLGPWAKPTALTAIRPLSDTLAVAKTAISDLESLPQKLYLSVRLPRALSQNIFKDVNTLQIASGLSVVSAKELQALGAKSSGNEKLDEAILANSDEESLDLPVGSHFLVKRVAGYAGSFTSNPTVRQFGDTVRSFFGLLLAEGVMEEGAFYTDPHKPYFVARDSTGDSPYPLVYTEAADSDLVYFFENFECEFDFMRASFDDDADEEGDSQAVAAEQAKGDKSPEEREYDSRCQHVIASLQSVFKKSDHSRKITTACLWLYRSYVSTRPLDSILESTIAIEVLLGDRDTADRIGLSKLMANRCAYLIGLTGKERLEIVAQFLKVYKMRSEIVHAGLHQITKDVREISTLSRMLAERVIRKEIELSN